MSVPRRHCKFEAGLLTSAPQTRKRYEDENHIMVAENIELLEDEKRMINDILDLADMTVREIMKPRVDMISGRDFRRTGLRGPLYRASAHSHSACRSITRKWIEVIGLVSYKDLIGPLLDGRIEDPVAEFM